MNRKRDIRRIRHLPLLAAAALFACGAATAQVPVDEEGNVIGPADEAAAGVDEAVELPAEELEALVGPIALYPDDLLAIVLPASTYPLEIVQAARFLERLETDSSLEPDESWDDSVVALLNYPEVVEMMSEDLEWTGRLGDAVLVQQADVIAAIERFRDRAYAAGNLESDGYQTVERNDEGAIEIRPRQEEIIYVPYYEPERVVIYQPRPVYYYYPQAYPVYYYPYPAHYSFATGYFWGVTTAFRIGWTSHHLRVFHHTYWGHPYYGRHYFGHYYRYPSISVFNSYYVNHDLRRRHHHRDGDFWRPRHHAGARPGLHRSRTAFFRERRQERTTDGYRNPPRYDSRQTERRPGLRGNDPANASSDGAADTRRGFAASRDDTTGTRRVREQRDREPIRFRPRAEASVSTGSERPAASSDEARRQAAAASRRARENAMAPPANRAAPTRNRAGSLERRNAQTPARTGRSAVGRDSTSSQSSQPASRGFSSPQPSAAPRSAPVRRASPPARTTSPSSAAPRATAPSRAAPHSAAPRATAPRPSASTPRSASQAAPARESRAAPTRRSGDQGPGNRARSPSRSQQR